MARGRRERDRPKAAPDALYNPNKRVRLSYGSQGEDEAELGTQDPPAVGGSVNANVGGPGENEAAGVSRKEAVDAKQSRAVGELNEHDEHEGPGEEQSDAGHTQYEETSSGQVKYKNDHTGQWHALGPLSWREEGDEEEEEGSADEALEYLRSVRSERQTMPAVLSMAPSEHNGGRYGADYFDLTSDNAFVAERDMPVEQTKGSPDPREAFTEALKKRFLRQRHQLHLPPSSEALAALDDKHPISIPRNNRKAEAEWLDILRYIAPAPAQVRSLEQDTVFRLLGLLQDRALHRQKDIHSITSAWIWALLARLDEVNLMNNDQVHDVRAFGKKAVLVLVSFRSEEAAMQLEELAGGEGGRPRATLSEHARDPDDTTAADGDTATHPFSASGRVERENTLATLDAILVIVGDVFGQRDLLEFRQTWESVETASAGG